VVRRHETFQQSGLGQANCSEAKWAVASGEPIIGQSVFDYVTKFRKQIIVNSVSPYRWRLSGEP
jgi:hypothetical protein